MVQVAKRGASVLKRRKSRNRMDTAGASGSSATGGQSSSSQMMANNGNDGPPPRSESDGDVVFYAEEPRSGEYELIILDPF